MMKNMRCKQTKQPIEQSNLWTIRGNTLSERPSDECGGRDGRI